VELCFSSTPLGGNKLIHHLEVSEAPDLLPAEGPASNLTGRPRKALGGFLHLSTGREKGLAGAHRTPTFTLRLPLNGNKTASSHS
jgi:hypothetical protein